MFSNLGDVDPREVDERQTTADTSSKASATSTRCSWRAFERVCIDELLAARANDDATTARAATANDGGADAPVAGHARGALDVEGMWTTGANDRAQWTTLSAQWAAGEWD